MWVRKCRVEEVEDAAEIYRWKLALVIIPYTDFKLSATCCTNLKLTNMNFMYGSENGNGACSKMFGQGEVNLFLCRCALQIGHACISSSRVTLRA
ncbi:hypothetical protein TNCV_1375181 [Trichonephila clavipes]|nr:hypothetical protein TNCV_1375181 [Trichonephila clavipes]